MSLQYFSTALFVMSNRVSPKTCSLVYFLEHTVRTLQSTLQHGVPSPADAGLVLQGPAQ
jgi:hypothetical protein